ncbi:MAG: GC-type dockerin domain-anchored protein [Planctomycetota bacterium]
MRTTRAWVWTGALVGLLGTDLCSAQIVYVDDDAPLGGDGRSWATAYRYLQDGFYDAQEDESVTEIRIGGGVYRPDEDEAGLVTPGDTEASFSLQERSVAIRGGFRGLDGKGDPDEQGDAFETTLSSAIGDPFTQEDDALSLVALRGSSDLDASRRRLRLERVGLSITGRGSVAGRAIRISGSELELDRVDVSVRGQTQLSISGQRVVLSGTSLTVGAEGSASLRLNYGSGGACVEGGGFVSESPFARLLVIIDTGVSTHPARAELEGVQFTNASTLVSDGVTRLKHCSAKDSEFGVSVLAEELRVEDCDLHVTEQNTFQNIMEGVRRHFEPTRLRLIDSRVRLCNSARYGTLISGADLIRTEIVGEGADDRLSGLVLDACGIISECTFRGIQAGTIIAGAERIERSSFIGNTTLRSLVTYADSNFCYPPISGSLFVDNVSGSIDYGGILAAAQSIRSSTFVGNSTLLGRPSLWIPSEADGEIVGCVIVSDAAVEGDIRDSVLWGGGFDQGVAGGNVFAEPVFVDELGPDGEPFTGDEDWTLAPGSPGVDLAELGLLDGLSRTDFNGNPRFVDSTGDGVFRMDAGAFERQDGAAAMCEAELLASGLGFAPDSSLTVQDLTRYVEQWIAINPFADHTTIGANPGDQAWAECDGIVSIEDLTRYVELWLEGCAG